MEHTGPDNESGWAPSPDERAPGLDLELLSSQLRADADDVDTFFAVLSAKLADALGQRVELQRRGRGLRRREAAVVAMAIDLTDGGEGLVLRAERTASGVQCTVARPVRGIVVSNRPVTPAEWVQTLVTGLAERAATSERAREALGGLLR